MRLYVDDQFYLHPVPLKSAETGPYPAPMLGRVIWMNKAHGFALVDFGSFRECFSFYGPGGLIAKKIKMKG